MLQILQVVVMLALELLHIWHFKLRLNVVLYVLIVVAIVYGLIQVLFHFVPICFDFLWLLLLFFLHCGILLGALF